MKTKLTWSDVYNHGADNSIIFLNPPEKIQLTDPIFGLRIKNKWQFKCKCGNIFSSQLQLIANKRNKSCGCKIKDFLKIPPF